MMNKESKKCPRSPLYCSRCMFLYPVPSFDQVYVGLQALWLKCSGGLRNSHCRYGDKGLSVSEMGLASCPSWRANSVMYTHTAFLPSLIPPLSPLHLHTPHSALAGDFQCIFNDDLARDPMINFRIAQLRSSTVKNGKDMHTFISP